MSVDPIYHSNVKPNMKNFPNNDRSIKESDQYDRNASKTDFRTVFRIFISYSNPSFFVPNCKSKFW